MTTQRIINIDPLSGSSLRVWPRVGGRHVATATGFVIRTDSDPYLITNWHVVTGVDPVNGKRIFDEPDELWIHHHAAGKLGNWAGRREALRDGSGHARWVEHNRASRVDVVALPLNALNGVGLHPLDLSLADTDMVPEPAMPVSIIGYPLGLFTGGGWPIWKTGHIASDPDLDYNNQPGFLVDVTARAGMSGSPAILRLSGGYRLRGGSRIMAQSVAATKFLGVYSAQSERAELGVVWRPEVIREILAK